jgi:hypothetical protein
MVENTLLLKQFRSKFVRDFNLPIQVVQSPYFEANLKLLENDCQANTKYLTLLETVRDKFDGNMQKFLEYRHSVEDQILGYILNSEAYKAFNGDKSTIPSETPIVGSPELYTKEQCGCFFISYDMVKANFQALRHANPAIVMDCESYQEFVEKFTDIDYFKHAKQLRQVLFGKLNGKRTAAIEKYISNQFAKNLAKRYEGKFKLYSIKTDEVILKFLGTEKEFEDFKVYNEVFSDFKFRVNKFKLTSRDFKHATSDRTITAYIKEDYLNGGKRTLHCVPDTYYPQVYKLLNGMEITPSDLKFYYDHELCTFDYPLELIK